LTFNNFCVFNKLFLLMAELNKLLTLKEKNGLPAYL